MCIIEVKSGGGLGPSLYILDAVTLESINGYKSKNILLNKEKNKQDIFVLRT